MNNFRLVNSETKPLTREVAEAFRDMEPSPTERELDPKRVKHLHEKAEHGQLITFQWSTARLGERMLRMNGQHSSKMLCDLNGEFPVNLSVHLDAYEVDDEMALAELFRQFDDRRSSRTAGDIAGAYQMLFEPVRDVPRAAAKLAVDGHVWWRRSVEGLPTKHGDELYELFNESNLQPFVRWIGEVMSIKTNELKRAPVVAAMYATFISSEADARKFWHDVSRGGVEYDDTAPSTVLDQWLKSLKEQPSELKLKPGNLYQGCIGAWNAFRDGKPITKGIKFDAAKGFHEVK